MRILLLSFAIFALSFIGIWNPVRDFVQRAVSPMQYGLTQVASEFRGGFTFVFNLQKVRQENVELRKDLAKLESQLLENKWAVEENKVLKRQLELYDSGIFDRNMVLSNVLGNPNDNSGETFILDKGSRQGIRQGNNVVSGNLLVGVVQEVTPERSVVYRVTSPQVSATVMDIDVAGKTEGLVTGQFGTSIEMSRILPNEEVNIGDTIVTSGKDGLFEPGLIIGKVVNVEEESSKPLKKAFISTVDLSELNQVFVILDS